MHYQFGQFVLDSHNTKLLFDGDIINDDERVVKTLQILCESYQVMQTKII